MIKDEKTKMVLFGLTAACLGLLLIFISSFNHTKNDVTAERKTVAASSKTPVTHIVSEVQVKNETFNNLKPENIPQLKTENDNDKIPTRSLANPMITLTNTHGPVHVLSVYSGNYKGSSSPNNEVGDVNVEVKIKTPITLFLNAYEPVKWHIKLFNGAKITEIITAGYYNQEVSGLSKNVPLHSIDNYYELKTGLNNENKRAQETIQKLIGEIPVSIQYKYTGTNFIIDNQK